MKNQTTKTTTTDENMTTEKELRDKLRKVLFKYNIPRIAITELGEDIFFEDLMKLIQNEREKVLGEVQQWAKEHNLCSDLVATSSLLRFLEKLAQKEE